MTLPFQHPPLLPFSDLKVAKAQARAWVACFRTLFPQGPNQHAFRHPENLNWMQTAVAEIQRLRQCEQQLNEWVTLTDWIQTAYSSNAHPLLSGIAGKHRAEVLRELAELSLAKGKADDAIVQSVVSEAVPSAAHAILCSLWNDTGLRHLMRPDQVRRIELYLTTPPAAPVAWDADATTRLRSIVSMLGLTDSVPDGDLTGHEFAVLGSVRREIERLKAPADAKPAAWIIKYPDGVVTPLIGETVPKVYAPFATPLFAAATQPTDADKRDAERLDFIEANSGYVKTSRGKCFKLGEYDVAGTVANLREAIDAAIAASAKEAK